RLVLAARGDCVAVRTKRHRRNRLPMSAKDNRGRVRLIQVPELHSVVPTPGGYRAAIWTENNCSNIVFMTFNDPRLRVQLMHIPNLYLLVTGCRQFVGIRAERQAVSPSVSENREFGTRSSYIPKLHAPSLSRLCADVANFCPSGLNAKEYIPALLM